jgi:hypothetical protein
MDTAEALLFTMQTHGVVPPPAPDCLAGGGEMGRRMRELDWSATPLGAPHAWPVPLQVVMRILLASREPLAVWWGAGQTLFFNDACNALIGADGEARLGGPVPEAWLDGRAPCRLSLHPVPGEHGQLGGVLCTFCVPA